MAAGGVAYNAGRIANPGPRQKDDAPMRSDRPVRWLVRLALAGLVVAFLGWLWVRDHRPPEPPQGRFWGALILLVFLAGVATDPVVRVGLRGGRIDR